MSAMTPEEALTWLDGTLAEFPEKVSDQEIEKSMRWQTTNIARDEPEAFMGALRLCLQRRTLPSLALDLAVHHHLTELRPDLEAVMNAIERGEGYPAYYREFLPSLRRRLEGL
jgi:hypothetical protein